MPGWLVPNLGKVSTDPGGDAIIQFPNGGDGDPTAAYALPGANGTWTNFIAGAGTTDTALAAAGKIFVEFGGQTGYVPWTKRT
jgi:hypothetical protein